VGSQGIDEIAEPLLLSGQIELIDVIPVGADGDSTFLVLPIQMQEKLFDLVFVFGMDGKSCAGEADDIGCFAGRSEG